MREQTNCFFSIGDDEWSFIQELEKTLLQHLPQKRIWTVIIKAQLPQSPKTEKYKEGLFSAA